jgi:hypothetical protein
VGIFYFLIKEVPNSNLDWATGCLNWGSYFISVFPEKTKVVSLNAFPASLSKSSVIRYSLSFPSHSTLSNLLRWNDVVKDPKNQAVSNSLYSPANLYIKTSSYTQEDLGSVTVRGKISLFVTTVFRPALKITHSPVQWVPKVLSPGVNRLERETGSLLPCGVVVENTQNFTSGVPFAFMAWIV